MQNSNTSIGVHSSLFLSFALVEQVYPCQLGAIHLWDLCWLTLDCMVHAVVMVNWAFLPVDIWLGG